MKNYALALFLTIASVFAACTETNSQSAKTENATTSKIEVFDFHTTHRFKTCNAIEASTKYTLNTYFKKELTEGKITLNVVNIDKEENEWLAEKFQVSNTALFLNVIKNGKERQIDLTNFAFMKGNDQQAFAKELKTKLEAELKTL